MINVTECFVAATIQNNRSSEHQQHHDGLGDPSTFSGQKILDERERWCEKNSFVQTTCQLYREKEKGDQKLLRGTSQFFFALDRSKIITITTTSYKN